MRRLLPTLLLAAVLLPAAPAAALPRLGDLTVGAAGGGSTRPVEPGDPDVLLSPMASAELGFQLPALLAVGAHGRIEAAGPAVGWDLTFAGVIGGGGTLHGDGRTSADLFLGLPVPVGDGWLVQPFFRGGPFLDGTDEAYGVFGLAFKWSTFLDRTERTGRVERPAKTRQRPPPPAYRPSRPRPSRHPAAHPHPSPPRRPGRPPPPRR